MLLNMLNLLLNCCWLIIIIIKIWIIIITFNLFRINQISKF